MFLFTRSLALVAALWASVIAAPAFAQTLPDEGPIATNPVPDIKAPAPGETLTLDDLPSKAKRLPPSENKVQVIGPAALLIASFDRNFDYRIDKSEFAAGQERAFAAADENGNGTLTLFELNSWREAALGREDARPGMIAFDSNYDQKITKTEFALAMSGALRRMDKDEDGELTFSELIRDMRMPARRAQPKRELGQRERQSPRQGQTRRPRGY